MMKGIYKTKRGVWLQFKPVVQLQKETARKQLKQLRVDGE